MFTITAPGRNKSLKLEIQVRSQTSQTRHGHPEIFGTSQAFLTVEMWSYNSIQLSMFSHIVDTYRDSIQFLIKQNCIFCFNLLASTATTRWISRSKYSAPYKEPAVSNLLEETWSGIQLTVGYFGMQPSGLCQHQALCLLPLDTTSN